MSKVEFPKPTESASAVNDYYEFIRGDESKELAQKIFDELNDKYLLPKGMMQVFARHGIIVNL